MPEHSFGRKEREESIDLPNRQHAEELHKRSIRLPWRQYRISLFWKFGFKVTRPKRTAVARPTPVRLVDPTA